MQTDEGVNPFRECSSQGCDDTGMLLITPAVMPGLSLKIRCDRSLPGTAGGVTGRRNSSEDYGWIPGPAWPTTRSEVVLAATAEARGKHHWAFQPIRPTKPPTVENPAWPRNEIDAFILAGWDATGLAPAPEADKAAWIRRVSFVLTGLPPTLDQVADFVASTDLGAYRRLVDDLRASPIMVKNGRVTGWTWRGIPIPKATFTRGKNVSGRMLRLTLIGWCGFSTTIAQSTIFCSCNLPQKIPSVSTTCTRPCYIYWGSTTND